MKLIFSSGLANPFITTDRRFFVVDAQSNWPFPPPTGPVPWTKKQEQEHKAQQRKQLPESPL
jgi:hypothetical protein